MVAVAVKPMMCYSHPNGRSSVLEYPSTFCGESTQLQMVVLGVVPGAAQVVGPKECYDWRVPCAPAVI